MSYDLQTDKGIIEISLNKIPFGPFELSIDFGNYSIPAEEFCQYVGKMAEGTDSLTFSTENGNVDISWNPKTNSIMLDKYTIEVNEFGYFVNHVFNGGLVGWDPNNSQWKPEYVKTAVDKIRENKHKKLALVLYESLYLR